MARRGETFDRKALVGSILVHGVILVLAVWSSMSARPPLEFVTYQIEIVSPPSATQDEEPTPAQEELVVEQPEPEPPPEPEETPTVETEKPPPKPPEPERPPEREPPKEPEEKKPPTSPDPPEETPRESGEDINVRLEGLRRDYPAYYNNIIMQIQRCFQWRGQGSWETTVYFVIRRDGSVTDLDFAKRSGNPTFDFSAMGAVECAGANARLGPLPEDLPFDVLPVQFSFRPQGGIRESFPDRGDQTTQVGSQR